MGISDEKLDAPMDLTISGWNGDPNHCVYLNNHRIAGGKPWGGGTTTKIWRTVSIRELARAIPALREVLALDYLGRPAATVEQFSKVGAASSRQAILDSSTCNEGLQVPAPTTTGGE